VVVVVVVVRAKETVNQLARRLKYIFYYANFMKAFLKDIG